MVSKPLLAKTHHRQNLTVRDNVCIAARDIDGDGRCEVLFEDNGIFRKPFRMEPFITCTHLWTAVTYGHPLRYPMSPARTACIGSRHPTEAIDWPSSP